MSEHKSDCAVHNAPALEAAECDCGAHPRVGAGEQQWARHTAEDVFSAAYLCPECHTRMPSVQTLIRALLDARHLGREDPHPLEETKPYG